MKKQGRPRFDDNLIEQVKARFPDVHSRRGLQKIAYAIEAYQVLKDLPDIDFLWVFDSDGNWIDMKRGLLSEIGRFEDPETIKGIAIRLCADQEHTPHSVEKWVKKLREVRLGNQTVAFLKGELSLVPFLAIRSFTHPGLGLVNLGTILELPIQERTHIVAPLRGELPAGWRTIAFLADNGVLRYGGTEMGLSKEHGYISLYRTAEEFFKVTLELDAPYAVATILGHDLQKPSNKVLALYEHVLPNTKNLRLRPMTSEDRKKEKATIETNYLAREQRKAMQEAKERYDPLHLY